MKHRILLVEDKEFEARAIKSILQDNYEVTVAHKPIDASVILELSHKEPNYKKRFSVAILDLSLQTKVGPPGVEGFHVLGIAIRDPFLIPIIFTGTGNKDKERESLRRGGFRYIEKGSRDKGENAIARLQDAIRDALQEREKLIATFAGVAKLKATLSTGKEKNDFAMIYGLLRVRLYGRGKDDGTN